MLDRVREALFSILQDEIPDAHVLDLFSGSGSLGLEALSRGAATARLVERDKRTARLVGENVETLRLGDRAEVVAGDALSPASWGDSADVVFYDPPYPMLKDKRSRELILGRLEELVLDVLTDGGPLVFHAPRRGVRAEEFGAGLDVEPRDYGTSTLWFVRATPGEDEGRSGDEEPA